MKSCFTLLTGMWILLFTHFSFAQQLSAPTVTLVKQRIIELEAIRQEGLISDDLYNEKNRQLQSLLKILSRPNSKSTALNKKYESNVPSTIYQPPTHVKVTKLNESDNETPDSANELADKSDTKINQTPLTTTTDLYYKNSDNADELMDQSTNVTKQNKPDISSLFVSAPVSPAKISEWNKKSLNSAIRGDWMESIRTSTVTILLDPNDVTAHINRCRALLERGDLDEAMHDCEAALKLEPKNMIAFDYRDAITAQIEIVNASLAEYDRACHRGQEQGCVNYRRIRGNYPKNSVPISKIISNDIKGTYSETNWDEMIENASLAIESSPEDAAGYVTRSIAYANTGHLQEALADAEAAIVKSPDEGQGFNSLGIVYDLMKKPRQAMLDYEIACNLQSELGCINKNRFLNK